jgi:hypothetical protein
MRLSLIIVASGLLILTQVLMKQAPPFAVVQVANAASVVQQAIPEVAQEVDSRTAVYQSPQDGFQIAVVRQNPTPTSTPVANVAPNVVSNAATGAGVTTESALATYRQQSALPITGYAMYYNPAVMTEVLNNRLRMGHVSSCPECVGNVALLRAGDLNRRVWLQWPSGVVEGPFLVADVAATHHVSSLLARNWVVDVDNKTAMRHRMAGPVLVTVWASPPSFSVQPQEPFDPLYAAVPTSAPTPTSLPAVNTLPAAYPMSDPISGNGGTSGGFPTNTPVSTVTPLPPVYAASGVPAQPVTDGFPIYTPAPTATTLPANVYAPTKAPAAGGAPESAGVTKQHAFPADTPVPTITPLPALQP